MPACPAHSAVDTLRAAHHPRSTAPPPPGWCPPRCCSAGSTRERKSALWQFTPTVINGSLGADSFLAASDQVTGVLGWHGLRVGDPARDLPWLLGAAPSPASTMPRSTPTRAVRGQVDRQLRQRATLLARTRDRPLAAARHRGALHRDRRRRGRDAVRPRRRRAERRRKHGPQTMPVLGVDGRGRGAAGPRGARRGLTRTDAQQRGLRACARSAPCARAPQVDLQRELVPAREDQRHRRFRRARARRRRPGTRPTSRSLCAIQPMRRPPLPARRP